METFCVMSKGVETMRQCGRCKKYFDFWGTGEGHISWGGFLDSDEHDLCPDCVKELEKQHEMKERLESND